MLHSFFFALLDLLSLDDVGCARFFLGLRHRVLPLSGEPGFAARHCAISTTYEAIAKLVVAFGPNSRTAERSYAEAASSSVLKRPRYCATPSQ